jgi:hypothetical protein
MPDSPRPAAQRLFGTDADGYRRGRPGYPSWLWDQLAACCGLAAGPSTLEIGAGAGQATAELLARGASPLVAVEPDAALAALLRARFGRRVRVVEQPFERFETRDRRWSLPLTSESARALFATFSPILALPDDERRDVLDRIARVVADDFGGRVARPCVTVLYRARRA